MKRFLALLLLPLAALADDWAPNLTVTAAWQDNASNADRSCDQIGALQTQGDLVANQRFAFGRDDSIHLGIHAAGEWWPRFQDLDTGAAGIRGDWQHKFGLGALAPVLSLELGADAVIADESGRRGTFTTAAVALRKRFNETWRATLTHEFSDHAARFAVYDRRATQSTLELGYDFSESARFTFAAFWRDGDVVSYATPPRPDLVALAPNRLTVETFRRPLTVYSIDARTLGGRIGFVHALNPNAAAIITYEWRETKHSPLRYVNQLVSVALVHQY